MTLQVRSASASTNAAYTGLAPISLSVLFAIALAISSCREVGATTLSVPSGSYPTIQSAVNAVPSTLTEPITIAIAAGTYREIVSITNKDGSAAYPLVIAPATPGAVVTIDGSDSLTSSWTLCSGNVWHTTHIMSVPSAPYVDQQLHVGATRCKYVTAAGGFCTIGAYEYAYDPDVDRLYVNAGGGTPSAQGVYISMRSAGIEVKYGDYLTLDGLTVVRTTNRGITIRGAASGDHIDHVNIQNCTSAFNWRHGIHVDTTSACILAGNATHHNGKDGIYLITSDNATVERNTSYGNDDPAVDGIGGSASGIQIGDARATTFPQDTLNRADVSYVTVDYNVVYDNEDTGLDVKSARQVLVRRNQSYRNRDHGYDNNNTSATTFMNNVAARNDHDGMSIESTSENVGVFNNIFWHNALNASTLAPQSEDRVREVFVDNTVGLATDYNVICGLAPGAIQDGTRYLVEFPSNNAYSSWDDYRAGQSNHDVHSHPFDLGWPHSSDHRL